MPAFFNLSEEVSDQARLCIDFSVRFTAIDHDKVLLLPIILFIICSFALDTSESFWFPQSSTAVEQGDDVPTLYLAEVPDHIFYRI